MSIFFILYGGPSDHFFAYYIGASRSLSSLIMEASLCLIFFILYRGPSSGVVENFLLWERLHSVMFTYPIVIGGGGGEDPE